MLTLFLMEDLICSGSDFLRGKNLVGLSIQTLLIGLIERPDFRRQTLKEEEEEVSAISFRDYNTIIRRWNEQEAVSWWGLFPICFLLFSLIVSHI